MQRITQNPEIMLGKPVIKGTRLTVEYIISLLAQNTSIEEILVEYKGLEKEDILACLAYAENVLKNRLVFDL